MHPWLQAGISLTVRGSRVRTAGNDKEELYHYFPEIFAASSSCRFNGCLHAGEPGCAVKEAVLRVVSTERYDSYLKLLDDPDGGKYRI